MSKRKSEDKLTRFVWKRNSEYDYLLLLEVESRNPFSFGKPKSVWQDIAKTLKNNALKMKVTDRSCRERVTELLKKHRSEEKVNVESTGGTEEGTLSAFDKLLTSVNEMEQAKPDRKVSRLYLKENKQNADSIRAAALMDLSDSDCSEDHQNKNGQDRPDNAFLPDNESDYYQTLTLEEEDRWLMSFQDKPSTSRNNKENQVLQQQNNTDEEDGVDSVGLDRGSMTKGEGSFDKESIHEHEQPLSLTKKVLKGKPPSSSNNRISNPKKDLINFLEKKAENEQELRRDEIRIREMEALNKKEELNILRLKTEAEAEERKKMNELLIQLVTKNTNQ